MSKKQQIIILTILTVIILGPLLYYHQPTQLTTPDIQYLKGKLLRVMEGEIYTDPISGYPNFHPPYFHMFLALFTMIGLPINTLMFLVTIVDLILLFYFLLKIYSINHGKHIALGAMLLVPVWMQFVFPGTMYMVSAFNFSLPIYFAGIYVYLTRDNVRGWILSTALWGIAFMISPWYTFILGFTLLYMLVIEKKLKKFLLSLATLAVVLIPFYIQAYVVFSSGAYGTAAFKIWPGPPGYGFFKGTLLSLFNPTGETPADPVIYIVAIFTIAGLFALKKSKSANRFILITAVAMLFTYYHYLAQYGDRVHLLLLLLLGPFVAEIIMKKIRWKAVAYAVIIIPLGLSLYSFYSYTIKEYDFQNYTMNMIKQQLSNGVLNQLKYYTDEDDFIVVTSQTYRAFILPHIPLHALKAWRTGEYFQLKTELAEGFENDYKDIMYATSIDKINSICDKYNIDIALIYGTKEMNEVTGLKLISVFWKEVYGDPFFKIFKRQ